MTFSRLELRSLGVGSISKKAESIVIVAPGLPAFAFTQSCARVGSEPVYGIVAQKARNGADPFVMSVADTVPTRVTDAVSSRTWLESRAAYVPIEDQQTSDGAKTLDDPQLHAAGRRGFRSHKLRPRFFAFPSISTVVMPTL